MRGAKAGGGKHTSKQKTRQPKEDGPKKTPQRDRVRLLKHLLKKEDLAGPAREKAQKELSELVACQQKAKQSEKERKLAVRYHKVRFFERVKVERRIARLERKAADGLSASQQQELEQCKADLQYIRHFPPGEKYVSLLRDAPTPEAQTHLDTERARLRALAAGRAAAAAQAAADIAALTQADEGVGSRRATTSAAPTVTNGPPRQRAVAVKTVVRQEKAAVAHQPLAAAVTSLTGVDDGGEDDDDFFLSDDDDEEEQEQEAGGAVAGQQAGAQPVVAKAWPKVRVEDSSEEGDEATNLGESGGSDGADDGMPQVQGGSASRRPVTARRSDDDGRAGSRAEAGRPHKRRRQPSGVQVAGPGRPQQAGGRDKGQAAPGSTQGQPHAEGGRKRKRRRK